MRFARIIFIILPVLSIYGCFDHELNGDAYVIKRGGDITPVAGRQIYLLPYENEISFLYDVSSSAYEKNKSNLSNRLEYMCKSGMELSVYKKNELDKKLEEIKIKSTIPQGGCDSIKISRMKLFGDKTFNRNNPEHAERLKYLSEMLDECKEAEALIISAEKSMPELDHIASDLSSCRNNNNFEVAISAIDKLNKNYDAKIIVPGSYESRRNDYIEFLVKKIKETPQARTTIHGSYEFTKVKEGKYLLFVEYNDIHNSGFWLKPVEIKDNMKVDLTNYEMIYVPFLEYVLIQLDGACKDCGVNDFNKSIKSRVDVVEQYEQEKEIIEKFKQAFESLLDNSFN